MESLKGKVVIITGASSGLGASMAVLFAKRGCRLSLTGRKQENLAAVAKQTGLGNDKMLTAIGDLRKAEFRKTLIFRTIEKYGKIDVLINNASVLYVSPLEKLPEEQFDEILDINLKSHVFLTKLALPHLLETKGNVINISSAITDIVVEGWGAYIMSKAALDSFTEVLADELGPFGVRVNALNPGPLPSTNLYTRSNYVELTGKQLSKMFEDMYAKTPLRRECLPDEIAQVATFLASDMASFVHGETLRADGGIRFNA
ncbi:uncharacterized oxidoreductase MexAM1_META1p0182-like [Haliotis rubra]|uniref:uncharacterized oxidoreductase MexAM1_META1p0182-like n=1 Tax=Haliotis rubra TaxID=36100 RepID=UPI001EE61703|nr:uncharacterized oxidoreductase MexAM1_META1p0182-like [Haliotis rubra]